MLRSALAVAAIGVISVLAAPAVSHAATPVQGIGVQLLDDGPPGVPDYGRPDVYIGAQDDGLLPAPIAAGTSQTWTVQVSNPGNITEQVSVYPAPASLRNGAWLPASAGADDASSWTGASPASLSLAPGASASVTVTVAVPPGTAPETTYGVLWAAVTPTRGPGLNLAVAAGIREYITVA